MKILNKLKIYFIYVLPVILYFSYLPRIFLGSNETMNFELSLPLIWLALFTLISLPKFKFTKTFWLASLLPLYATLSILWSPNKLRAILTSGIILCLLISIFSIVRFIQSLKKSTQTSILDSSLSTTVLTFGHFKTILFRIFLASTLVVCLFCWLQFFLNLAELNLGLCKYCGKEIFGFPHPNGFAIEPQFMGNLLLAPALLSLYFLVHQKTLKKSPKIFRLLYLISIFITSTLFLTLSRGAVYAFLLSACLTIFVELARKNLKSARILVVIFTSLFITLFSQGAFSELNHYSFFQGVSTSVSQLTMGNIEIPYKSREVVVPQSKNLSTDGYAELIIPQVPTISSSPAFTSNVPESTDIRMKINYYALETWATTPEITLFGTGLGGAGVKLYENHKDLGSPKEIVQNEPLAVLLETGIIGFSLLILSIIIIFKKLQLEKTKNNVIKSQVSKSKSSIAEPQSCILKSQPLASEKIYLLALLFAYAFSMFFFSGLPNALHIYLLPPLFYVIISQDEKIYRKRNPED